MFGMTLSGNEFEIDLYRHRLAAELQFVEQLGDGRVLGNLAALAVDGELHSDATVLGGRVGRTLVRLTNA